MSCYYCCREGHTALTCPDVPGKVAGPERDPVCPECGTPSDEYDQVRRMPYTCEECGRRF